jgi:ankyrin repeat protein
MLISSRFPAPPPTPHSSMTVLDNHSTDRNHQISTPSLTPPTSLPKYFNVPFAIQHGYFRCIRYLLQLHYDPNERDGQLRTPLILCAYVENDRWSLSLAQNLLEKGGRIALEDHARRNA